ncbi:PulJ/GspJ family protein [Anthocerotibacter panamensis]|uniref:PulJ/GspJ family protein n=1 Tax=Anthocerotibacter panamensis TaxID=2857077 RepID=UPI001C405014|nr:prepilin-type N-terminal cleavage/methylation domain-containing protein [Anthocerotibacter panamensis]
MRKSSGFTLSELLVAIVITGILGVGASAAVANFTKRNLQEANTTTSRAQLQRAVVYISRDLRKSVRIATAVDAGLLPNYPTAPASSPILALWRLRDGDLGANGGRATGCLNASPYEFRAYYLVPAPPNLRGPNVLALYVNNCPANPVPTEGAISAKWGPPPVLPNDIPLLLDSVANGGFTAQDSTLAVPVALLTSVTPNPNRAALRIQGAVDEDLLNGTNALQRIQQQRDLTLNTVVTRSNF